MAIKQFLSHFGLSAIADIVKDVFTKSSNDKGEKKYQLKSKHILGLLAIFLVFVSFRFWDAKNKISKDENTTFTQDKCQSYKYFSDLKLQGYEAIKSYVEECSAVSDKIANEASAAMSDFGINMYNINPIEAKNAERISIKLNDRNANAHINLGKILIDSGNSEEGEKEIERSVELNPNSPDAHYNLALIFEKYNQLEKAASEYVSTINLDKKYQMAYINLGVVLTDMHRFDLAIHSFQTLLLINKFFPEAYNGLCNAYRHKGDLSNSLKNCLSAISQNGNDYRYYNNLGATYLTMNRLSEALAQFDKAISLNPSSDIARNNKEMIERAMRKR